MNQRTRFFKSGITLTAVGLAMRTVSMLFGAYISRAVGAEGVGLYTVVMTVYSFAVTFATSGISLTVTRLVATAIGEGREGELGGILRSCTLYSLIFGIGASALLLLGSDFIGFHILSDSRTVLCLKILSLSLIPAGLCSVFSGYFVGVRRVGFNAAVQVASQIIKIAVTLFLVGQASSLGIVASVCALSLGITLTELFAFLLILLEFLYDRYKWGTRVKKNGVCGLKNVASETLPLAISGYFRSILTTVEHILIPRRLLDRGETTSDAYSHYGSLHGMAIPLVLYPMSPLTSFSGLLVPEFASDLASGNKSRMSRIASEALNLTLIYGIFSAAVIYSFSEELGFAVYNSYDAGYYIAILAPIVPIMYLDHVTDSMLKGVGEQVYSMWVNITDSLLSVLLVYFLIPKMGISGYALVIIIMEGYNFLLSFIRLRKKVSFSLHLFRSVALPLICALSATALADALFVFGGSTSQSLWLTLKIVFTTATFVFIYFAFRSCLDAKAKKI
ncbi:MAG: oligosaccharide flippase family protein [Clostridia bacterium]|nr:oligosaccharide flippase family protein [Clostridia bacterium]